ncbi:DUF2852 domain-containing protein [Roseinatronobacter sp. S2]|uniref:DUF2852 domain-containing protein n=1 Tax=Roseinatronobacter sp. S2 TaxID=3035471 RepID=UPI0024108F72|nr:DUF2852 domain-containing protein [Roseinatronobacter sp. S2]WFE73333.1 DUF2852 domain-containing protein [Roseinatronobacter sp. S2]
MTTMTAPMSWARQAEAWLDGFGKAGWITAMVLAFILFWPLGLALLAYMIWGKQMFGKSCRTKARHGATMMRSSGNSAFDAYKADTLRRLEDEQTAFDTFLHRLRDAKDKAEFDQFMEDNRRKRDASQTAADPL